MISKLSIKQKLIAIMLIPLVIVILLAAKLAYDSYRSLENLKSLDKVVILSTKIGALVHETQKERGMTAGFIGSKGVKFKDDLPKQREEVNKQITFLNEFLSDKFPAYNQVIEPGEFEKKGSFNTTTAGFRYLIHLGYRF